mmetsp:Transcript_25349/g.40645  ORF Transcript_25349/g.40645 Transcript_25349/m.40645 type:complete len:114 (+) Transcript_25349:2153-2494(+)
MPVPAWQLHWNQCMCPCLRMPVLAWQLHKSQCKCRPCPCQPMPVLPVLSPCYYRRLPCHPSPYQFLHLRQRHERLLFESTRDFRLLSDKGSEPLNHLSRTARKTNTSLMIEQG